MSSNVIPLRRPDKTVPIRWRKALGDPTCAIEYALQHSWLLVPYIALVVTAILVVEIYGLSVK